MLFRSRVREANQARAINKIVNALKPEQQRTNVDDPPLRVVNGISTQTSSLITVAARENVRLSTTEGIPGRPGNSTIKWGGGLVSHPEQELEEESALLLSENDLPPPEPKKVITPSLAMLERAVSARIYFETLYFPLLCQAPSREQRRLAMERDYLRKHRHKVDVSAFIQFKMIGHDENATGSYDCLQTPKLPHANIAKRITLMRNESLASCSL